MHEKYNVTTLLAVPDCGFLRFSLTLTLPQSEEYELISLVKSPKSPGTC